MSRNRQRQYHQQNNKPSGEIRHITTKSGFRCDIPLERMDDWRIVETLAMAKKSPMDSYTADIILAERLLGEDGKERLMKHVQEKDGRIPFSSMDRELTEIFLLFNTQSKNSAPSPT
jgi:hypothetical protein